jgi:hypothetical protein
MKTQNQDCSESCHIEDQDPIVIFLTTPQSAPKRATVSKYANVSTVLSLLPPGKKTVFSGGSVIDQKKTFHELDIKSHSKIAVIDGENLSFNQEIFWKRATKKDEESTEQQYLMGNLQFKREFCQIIDIKMIQVENKTKSARKLIRMNMIMTGEEKEKEKEKEDQHMITVIEYEKKMNETALPVLW